MTVGLPVHNGERFLAETLGSILGQTYDDFELLIVDNDSRDGTAEIALGYAGRDRRIRYLRNDVNIGADRNYNRCVELASGDYFWGIGYDDLAHPRYLEKCVEALDSDTAIVLCHTRVYRIDETGATTGEYDGHNFSDSPQPHERFFDAILRAKWTIACHGVLRLSALRKTPLLIAHPAADTILQAELALLGRIREIPEFLFFHRVPWVPPGARDRMEWSEPGKRDALVFPHWRRLGELFRSVARTPLGFGESAFCYLQIARYLLTRRMATELPRDLKNAAAKLASRSATGRRLLHAYHNRDAPKPSEHTENL